MKYNKLGKTGLDVSVICLGTMTFGEQNTEAEGHQQLDYALDNGVNFIDTAELYAVPSNKDNNGLTETYIGTWLKNRADRDKMVVATKIAGPSPNLSYIRPNLDFSKEQINTAVEGSLRRLQTDYIDLYQLHWPERRVNFFGKRGYKYSASDPWEDNFHAILESMQELVQAGKIRHFGISNETPWGLMHFLNLAEKHGLPRCVSIQNPYSLLNRTFEVGLAEIAVREQAGLLAYSPMGFGLLSGKYHNKKDQKRDRLNRFDVMARYSGDNSHKATAEYLKIAEKHGLSLAQLSLQFINTRPFITSTIIGATTMEQLKENIESVQVDLTKEILAEIEAVHELIPNPAP